MRRSNPTVAAFAQAHYTLGGALAGEGRRSEAWVAISVLLSWAAAEVFSRIWQARTRRPFTSEQP